MSERRVAPPHRRNDPEATREQLLQCAFHEIYEHGYSGASIDSILANSGLTKGALYHHFGSKAELTYAVIDEVIRPFIVRRWIGPLQGAEDPITALASYLRSLETDLSERELCLGCPLNNLSQELAAESDEFRIRMERVFAAWRGGLADVFRHGQACGTVRSDVPAEAMAAYVVSSFEGMATTMKSSRDRDLVASIARMLAESLEGFRASAPADSAA